MKAPLSRLASTSLAFAAWSSASSRFLLDDQVVLLDGLADHGLELVGLPGLGDVAEDVPLVDRVDDRADVGVGREQQPGGLGADGLGLVKHLDAGHAGHPLVRQDHGDLGCGLEELERLGSALAGDDLVVDPEQVVDRAKDFGLVIDHQHLGSRPDALHGRSPLMSSDRLGPTRANQLARGDVRGREPGQGSCTVASLPFFSRSGRSGLRAGACRKTGRSRTLLQGEPLDQRHLVAHVVVAHFIDHSLADQEAESAGAEAELLADVEVRERVIGHRGVGQVRAVEARPLVADHDLEVVFVDPIVILTRRSDWWRLPHSMALWAISMTAWRSCMTCSLVRGVVWQTSIRKSFRSLSRVISLLSSTWISPWSDRCVPCCVRQARAAEMASKSSSTP